MSGTYYDIIQDFKELLVDYLDSSFASDLGRRPGEA